MTSSYKELHEQFMTNLNGTTYSETFLLVTPSILTVFLSNILTTRSEFSATAGLGIHEFLIEFFVIVIPAILSLTLLVDYIIIILSTLIVLILTVVFYPIKLSFLNKSKKCCINDILDLPLQQRYKPFITNFRASTNSLTAVCILAVDFPIFPRRLAKTETFGYSLMDAGVGVFCIANAIVSPEVLRCRTETKTSSHFFKLLRNCIPLLLLGAVRFFTTKQVDYQVHISEYGVHWNFFITLAIAKLFCSLLLTFYNVKNSFLVSFLVISIHEFILWVGVEEWVLSDIPRSAFVSANREGIVSSLGYIALFTAGEGLGYFIFRRSETVKDRIWLNFNLLCMSLCLWIITIASGDWFPVSRRLANFGYYSWILTISITTLTLFLFFDILLSFFRFYFQNCSGISNLKNNTHVPVILDAVSYNGLPFFLVANLLTGLVNISVRTLYVERYSSMLIIIFYMFMVHSVTFLLYCKKIKLKM